jgi:hypothetical protein
MKGRAEHEIKNAGQTENAQIKILDKLLEKWYNGVREAGLRFETGGF